MHRNGLEGPTATWIRPNNPNQVLAHQAANEAIDDRAVRMAPFYHQHHLAVESTWIAPFTASILTEEIPRMTGERLVKGLPQDPHEKISISGRRVEICKTWTWTLRTILSRSKMVLSKTRRIMESCNQRKKQKNTNGNFRTPGPIHRVLIEIALATLHLLHLLHLHNQSNQLQEEEVLWRGCWGFRQNH